MSNLIFIRGYEIDIPKTMLQHHITNIVDLEKHLRKLIKQRTSSFRLLILRNNTANINDAYKMYIVHKHMVKEKNNNQFTMDEKQVMRTFFVVNGQKYNSTIKKFISKVETNKQHIVVKNNEYTTFYDTYEDLIVY